MVSWELLEEPFMEDGRPFSVTQFYTVSLHEKAKLRADLESWRGRKFTAQELEGFDLASVVGAYCMIQVVHDETGKYANVQTIMAFKGDKPKPVNPDVLFDIDEPDMEVFKNFSDNMQLKISSAPEWNKQLVEEVKPAEKLDTIAEVKDDEEINLADIPF